MRKRHFLWVSCVCPAPAPWPAASSQACFLGAQTVSLLTLTPLRQQRAGRSHYLPPRAKFQFNNSQGRTLISPPGRTCAPPAGSGIRVFATLRCLLPFGPHMETMAVTWTQGTVCEEFLRVCKAVNRVAGKVRGGLGCTTDGADQDGTGTEDSALYRQKGVCCR